MRTLIFITLFCLIWLNTVAQAPQAFKYQAVARNTAGEVLANKSVSFRIGILSGSATGTAVYTETHTGKTTNSFGLVDLEVGKGTPVTGTFAGINWGTNDYFLKVEMDPNGGSAYLSMGASQLLSVPYALYARNVENNTDGDADATNELQKLTISGTVLTLDKSGGSVTLPSGGTSGDNWGTQAVVTDATLAGNGTTATPLKIADNGITSAKIQDAAIVTADLADQTVSTAKLGNLAVSADKIQNGAIITDKLANGSVTGAKIAQAGATSGQALKWNGTTWSPANDNSSLWQQSGSMIYYNDGYAGIGINDPKSQLHLNSSGVYTGLLMTSNASGTTINDGFLIGSQYQADDPLNRYALILNQENSPLLIGTNNSYQNLTLLPGGNIGIATTEPTSKLDINGQIRIRGGSPGAGKVLTSDANGLAAWLMPSGGLTLPFSDTKAISGTSFEVINSSTNSEIDGVAIRGKTHHMGGYGVWGESASTTGGGVGVFGLTANSNGFSGYFSGGKFYVNGNVGIGVTNPNAKLEVAGQVMITGGSPGAGKILTSDVNGLASWQTITPNPWLISGSNIYFNAGNVGIGKDPGTDARKFQSVTGSNVAIAAENNSNDIYLPALFAQNHGSGFAFISDGKIKIIDGTQGNGKVLTSDANGWASWQIPAGGFSLPFEGSTLIDGPAFLVVNTNTSGTLGTAIYGRSVKSNGVGVIGEATSNTGAPIGVYGTTYSPTGFSGYFSGGKFHVSGNVGIGKTDPYYKLDVTGNRIRLNNISETTWIAMRTDGSADFLDLSFAGGKLAIGGSNAGENILLNPATNAWVGVRTWNPQYELDVTGNVRATGSVFYGGTAGAANGTAYNKPDYVFGNDYVGISTEQVEDFLNREDHLPWVTSSIQERKENGEVTDMTRMAFETLESVENLQLQLIEQNKVIQSLKAENNQLKAENVMLKERDTQVVARIENLEKLVGASAQK